MIFIIRVEFNKKILLFVFRLSKDMFIIFQEIHLSFYYLSYLFNKYKVMNLLQSVL